MDHQTGPLLGLHLHHPGLPITALGFLNPIIAAAAMALRSLSVIVNSALLRRVR